MGKINLARVFLGGLLAGLIINIFEYILNGVVFAPQWDAFEKAHGHQMRPGAIPFLIVSAFVAGIGVVWLYALARPRLGPGPKTAALTGIATGSSPTRFQTPPTSSPMWSRGASHSPSRLFCLSACSSPPFAAHGFTKSRPNP